MIPLTEADVAAAVAEARSMVSGALLDRCTVKGVAAGSPDGFGGTAFTTPTVASAIPCLYEPIRPQPLTATGGAVSGATRHRIYLLIGDVDLQSIGPFYQIVVAARGDKGVLTFEDCQRLDESNEVLLTVSAMLKQ